MGFRVGDGNQRRFVAAVVTVDDLKPHSTNLSAASTAESKMSSLQGLMSQKAPPQPNRSKHEYRTCRFWGEQQFTIAQTHPDRPSSSLLTLFCATCGALVVAGVGGGGRAVGALWEFMTGGRLGRCNSGRCARLFVFPG